MATIALSFDKSKAAHIKQLNAIKDISYIRARIMCCDCHFQNYISKTTVSGGHKHIYREHNLLPFLDD